MGTSIDSYAQAAKSACACQLVPPALVLLEIVQFLDLCTRSCAHPERYTCREGISPAHNEQATRKDGRIDALVRLAAKGHNARRAAARGRRAARIAGGTPPRSPIASANTIPPASNDGVMRNAKARWENVCQFIAPVVSPFKGSTAIQPSNPTTREINSASKTNDRTMLEAPKPRARMVAISRERSATAEYMVFSAPKIAPTPMIPATNPPRMVMSLVSDCDCLS